MNDSFTTDLEKFKKFSMFYKGKTVKLLVTPNFVTSVIFTEIFVTYAQ